MKSSPSTFQLVVIAIFILLGITGVIVFAGLGGVNAKKVPTATIWGTVPAPEFNEMIRLINAEKPQVSVTYVQKNPERFQEEFVNALAEETGPDIVLLSDDLLYSQKGKLMVIPYTTYDQRSYSDTYLNAADHFMTPEGLLGVPFTADPIVMYYNRRLLSTAGIAEPPKLWSELETMVPKLVNINETKGITRSAIALGEARNVTNAKEILVTMFMQAGNPVTVYDEKLQTIRNVIDNPSTDQSSQSSGGSETTGSSQSGISQSSPGESVLRFYTTFSNPADPLYTWSRSMPTSKQAFLAGDLAIYIGYASEYARLRLENPNLDFDVATVPQNSASYNVTYGKITAFSIVKRPKDAQAAFDVILKLTEAPSQKLWVDISRMPPVRKDLLSVPMTDKFLSVFYKATIQSKTWFDPDPAYSSVIFQDMIESVTTGLSSASDAITTAKQRLDLLLQGTKS